MMIIIIAFVAGFGIDYIYQGRTCETHLIGGCILVGSALIALAISELKDGIVKQMKKEVAEDKK